MEKWYRLDNAALIYAPSANAKWSCVFRIACCLKEPVKPELLQQALDDVLPRFPTFNVKLRAGVFWYYLGENKKKLKIEEEIDCPCRYLDIRTSEHLLRVLYYNCRIALEVFHGISDGGGGTVFLKTLVRRYLELCGAEISGYDGCLNYLDKPTKEETQDAYYKVADKKNFASRSSPVAYKAESGFVAPGRYYLLHGEMATSDVKAVAKAYGCSVGHLLAAAIAYAFVLHKKASAKTAKKKNLARPVVLCASIDLRRRFENCNTLRNFSHFINIVIQHEEDFSSVLSDVIKGFDSITDEYVMRNVNSNVRDATRPSVRFLPLVIKNIGMNIGYQLFGEQLNSVSMSNYGPAKCPQGFENYVDRFESAIGVAKVGRNIDTSIVSFNNKTVLTFCSMGNDTQVEQFCFQTLSQLGIRVTVDGNRRDFDE